MRKRLCLGLLVLLVSTLGAVCWRYDRTTGPDAGHYKLIKVGMSLAQVKEVLGSPATPSQIDHANRELLERPELIGQNEESDEPIPPGSIARNLIWLGPEVFISVFFDNSDVVVSHYMLQMRPLPFSVQMRRLLHS